MLAGIEPAPPGTVARLWTKDQWISKSTLSSGLFKKKQKRPEGLEKIDAAVAAYDAFGDLDALMKARSYDDGHDLVARQLLDDRASAISNIKDAVGGWKRSRKASAKGWAEVEALAVEAEAERKKVSDVVGRWETAAREAKVEARGQKMDPLIPKDLNTKKGVDEKAQELFTIFMRFRGSVEYKTSSKAEFWDGGSGPFACATFANGFRDFLRRAGIQADTVPISAKNFITQPIGDTFIDATSNGNLKKPGETTASVKRFFFSEHHVVSVRGGGFYCPTSGVKTDQSGANIVDTSENYAGFAAAPSGAYQNARYEVVKVEDTPKGSLYEVRPRKAAPTH